MTVASKLLTGLVETNSAVRAEIDLAAEREWCLHAELPKPSRAPWTFDEKRHAEDRAREKRHPEEKSSRRRGADVAASGFALRILGHNHRSSTDEPARNGHPKKDPGASFDEVPNGHRLEFYSVRLLTFAEHVTVRNVRCVYRHRTFRHPRTTIRKRADGHQKDRSTMGWR